MNIMFPLAGADMATVFAEIEVWIVIFHNGFVVDTGKVTPVPVGANTGISVANKCDVDGGYDGAGAIPMIFNGV